VHDLLQKLFKCLIPRLIRSFPLVKRIISDNMTERIIDTIREMNKRQAINEIIISENVKEATAKRYIRYVKSYYIKIRIDMREPLIVEPEFFKPLPRKDITRRKKITPKGVKLPKKLYFTHRFQFKCKVVSPTGRFTFVTGIVTHYFSYTSFNPVPSVDTAVEKHDTAYPRHEMLEVFHLDTKRPRFT